jgi:hypothetical protein
MGGQPLDASVVGVTATPDGQGYWLVGSDGGVFAFGDAGFYGSTGGTVGAGEAIGLIPNALGAGYALVRTTGAATSFP